MEFSVIFFLSFNHPISFLKEVEITSIRPILFSFIPADTCVYYPGIGDNVPGKKYPGRVVDPGT